MVNVLENRSTSLNHCFLGGFCVKEDVDVLIHVPGAKPKEKQKVYVKYNVKQKKKKLHVYYDVNDYNYCNYSYYYYLPT